MNRLATGSVLKAALERSRLDAALTSGLKMEFGPSWNNQPFSDAIADLKVLFAGNAQRLSDVSSIEVSMREFRESAVAAERAALAALLPKGTAVSEADIAEPNFAAHRAAVPALAARYDALRKDYEANINMLKAEQKAAHERVADYVSLAPAEFEKREAARLNAGFAPNPLAPNMVSTMGSLTSSFEELVGTLEKQMDAAASMMNQIESEIEIFEQERQSYADGSVTVADEYKYRPEWKDAAEDDAWNDRWLPVTGDRDAYTKSENDPHPRESFVNKPWIPPPE